MNADAKLTRLVGCETCGNQYDAAFDRCPRCQSNQKSLVKAANDSNAARVTAIFRALASSPVRINTLSAGD
jgi:predicted ATP-dependent serine protease